ncbi:MAG: nitrophenyl compound nitroreductase subunit ArsF family protein [Marinilabiliaceae bacterium]
MKKTLSTLAFFMLLAVVSVTAQCCNSSARENDENQNKSAEVANDSDVEAYYFHATRRCATCKAVEDVTKEAIQENFGDKVKFKSINREKQKDHPMMKKHNVSGQTLLIVKGDEAENLTNFAFMNARSNPEKLKNKIKETVESL